MRLDIFDYRGQLPLAYMRFDFENVNGWKLIKINFPTLPGELNIYMHAKFLSAELATCAKYEVSLQTFDGWTQCVILIEMMKK